MIKAIITDVGGVLTDSGEYWSESGHAMLKFSDRDLAAAKRLAEAGIPCITITPSDGMIIKKWVKLFKPMFALYAVGDKLQIIQNLCFVQGLDLAEVVYIGDDTDDIPVLKAVGHPYCPADASAEVVNIGPFLSERRICGRKGGEGVFAEVVDRIINLNKIEKERERLAMAEPVPIEETIYASSSHEKQEEIQDTQASDGDTSDTVQRRSVRDDKPETDSDAGEAPGKPRSGNSGSSFRTKLEQNSGDGGHAGH